jgi:hypothetical protein
MSPSNLTEDTTPTSAAFQPRSGSSSAYQSPAPQPYAPASKEILNPAPRHSSEQYVPRHHPNGNGSIKSVLNPVDYNPGLPSRSSIPSNNGHGQDLDQLADLKFEKDLLKFQEALDDVSPEAAQKILQKNWRAFLFEPYHESHISFILRAGVKNAQPKVIDRIFKENKVFSDTLISYASDQPRVMEEVLEKVQADHILALVQKRVLHQVVLQHLRAAPSEEIVKMLATTGRLGYSTEDLVHEDDTVIPYIPPETQSRLDQVRLPEPITLQSQREPLPTDKDRVLPPLAPQYHSHSPPGSGHRKIQQAAPKPCSILPTPPPNPNSLPPPPPPLVHNGKLLQCPTKTCAFVFPTFSGYNYVGYSVTLGAPR